MLSHASMVVVFMLQEARAVEYVDATGRRVAASVCVGGPQ